MRITVLLLVACLFPAITDAAGEPHIAIGSVRVSGVDDPAAASPAFDDAGWISADWRQLAFEDVTWLRVPVEIPANAGREQPLALFMTAAVSVEAWWDGEPIGRNGRPSATLAGETPGRMQTVFMLAPRQLAAGTHLLAMRLSRQHDDRWVWTPIDRLYIGAWRDPSADILRYYLPSMVSGGALAFAGLFLLVLGRRDRAAPWLAAACFALLLQLGFESLRAFVNYPYTWHGPRLIAIGVAAWLFGFSLLRFLLLRLRHERSARWLATSGLLAALAFALVGDLIAALVLFVFLLGGVIIALRAAVRGQRDAWPLVVVLSLAVVLLLLQTIAFLDQWLYAGFALMLALFAVDHARAHFRTVRERDAARHVATRLELDLLRQHLKPHFLMNSLTALAEWVEESPRTGVAMVHALAEEFRTLIDISDRALIPLEQELALCHAHLRVMSFRRDRDYVMEVDHAPDVVAVPPAVLHTLVENAVTHSGNASAQPIRFSAMPANAGRWRLRLECPADGKAARETKEGTGLAYVRARLSEAFGDAWRLEQGAAPHGGWFTEIEIPERACA